MMIGHKRATNMFQNVFDADSQFTEKEKNMRPDLYVHGKRDSYYNEYKNIVIDASWIHPFPFHEKNVYKRKDQNMKPLQISTTSSSVQLFLRTLVVSSRSHMSIFKIFWKSSQVVTKDPLCLANTGKIKSLVRISILLLRRLRRKSSIYWSKIRRPKVWK